MSYNSISYFDLNLKTLTPLDKFVMRAFVEEPYLTNIYQSINYAQQLKMLGKTYCYKYVPLDPGLYPKIYDQNELIDLAFIATIVDNPYTYDYSKPFYINGRVIFCDAVDQSFIITLKGKQFYDSLFEALEMAKNYRTTGRYYCYYLRTPFWFPPYEQFNAVIPGQKLILLWYNKDYIINGDDHVKSILSKYSRKND